MTTATPTLGKLLAEVSTELARMEKRGRAPQAMGGFAFVQESDVIEALKPLLDARGIVLMPDVEDVQLHFYPRQGKDSPGVLATVKLAMHAVLGEESRLLFRTVGQGADTQDKAPAKAITAAKKQGFLIAFSIPTGDDPEATHLDSDTNTARFTTAVKQPVAVNLPRVIGDGSSEQPATDPQKRLIRAKQKEAGLTDDELATIRVSETGKRSSREFTGADVDTMLKAITAAGLVKAAAGEGAEIVA